MNAKRQPHAFDDGPFAYAGWIEAVNAEIARLIPDRRAGDFPDASSLPHRFLEGQEAVWAARALMCTDYIGASALADHDIDPETYL